MTTAHAALAALESLRSAKVRVPGQPALSHVLDEVQAALRETLAELDFIKENRLPGLEADADALADANARIEAALACDAMPPIVADILSAPATDAHPEPPTEKAHEFATKEAHAIRTRYVRLRVIELLQRWVNDATATDQADAILAEFNVTRKTGGGGVVQSSITNHEIGSTT